MNISWRDDLLELCEKHFNTDLEVRSGKMMGHPGFKIAHNNKFFMFIYEDGIALKMPPERYDEAMARDDVTGFQPGSDTRPMSTWIVWSCAEPAEYEEEWQLIDWARSYVLIEPPNPKKKKKTG